MVTFRSREASANLCWLTAPPLGAQEQLLLLIPACGQEQGVVMCPSPPATRHPLPPRPNSHLWPHEYATLCLTFCKLPIASEN